MTNAPDTAPSERLLEIRTVDVITGRGRLLTLSSVRCPLRSRTAAVEECADCVRSAGVAQGALAQWSAAAPPSTSPIRVQSGPADATPGAQRG